MNALLDNAVAAHGSSDRWNQVKSITVDAAINGLSGTSRVSLTRSRMFALRWTPRGSG